MTNKEISEWVEKDADAWSIDASALVAILIDFVQDNNLSKAEVKNLPIDVVMPFPTEEEIEVSADKWCDERAESYNAQHFAYTQGAQYIIDVLKGKA